MHNKPLIQQQEFGNNASGGTPVLSEIKQWEIDRGYIQRGSSKESEYTSYDFAKIESLAESGDMEKQQNILMMHKEQAIPIR